MTSISIIVPVYNVEKYLAKCLNSVLHTAWKELSYEIIVVDDATPDGSLAIAQQFAQKYPCIKIISQLNKGLGGARNTGVDVANGEFLFFLDSDDYLVNDQMPALVEQALQQKVDILEFSACTVNEDNSIIKNIFPVKELSSLSGQDYFGSYHPSNSVCNKLYRRAFLLENEIQFMENVYVEDAPFNVEAYSKAASVASYPLLPVAFLQNSMSITRKKRTGDQMTKFIEDSIKVTERMSVFLSANSPQHTQDAVKRKLSVFVSGTLLMILTSDKNLPSKLKYLKILQSKNLYPMNYNSGIRIRDLFLLFANRPFLFSLLTVVYRIFNRQ